MNVGCGGGSEWYSGGFGYHLVPLEHYSRFIILLHPIDTTLLYIPAYNAIAHHELAPNGVAEGVVIKEDSYGAPKASPRIMMMMMAVMREAKDKEAMMM